MTGRSPGDWDRLRHGEAEVIGSKCPGWYVMYGPYSLLFWAFGAPDGRPISARSASELVGFMRAAERLHSGPSYQQGPPFRHRPGMPG